MSTIHNKFKNLGINLSLGSVNGTWRQNYIYCSKEDKENFWRFGIDEKDIEDAGEVVKAKRDRELEVVVEELQLEPLNKVAKRHGVLFIKNATGITAMKHIIDEEESQRSRPICVTVVYGKGGVGKSSWCHEKCKEMGIRSYDVMNPKKGSVQYILN